MQVQAALVSVTGDGEIISAISVQEDSVTNTLQQGFNEKQGVDITGTIDIDGGTLSNVKVDSHLIFLNTASGSLDTDADWTFDGLIVGVLSDQDGVYMTDTDGQFAAFSDYFTTGTPAPFITQGLESNDSYSIAGNVLSMNMRVSEPGDWVRVVTVSAVPIPAAALLFAPALLGFMGLRRKPKKPNNAGAKRNAAAGIGTALTDTASRLPPNVSSVPIAVNVSLSFPVPATMNSNTFQL